MNIKYIDWNDYTISISNSNLKEIVEQGVELTDLTEEELLNNSELTAQAEINAYLAPVYDMALEFAKNWDDTPPDTRNKLVILCCVNCSLYHLHCTISPRDVPEKVEKMYEHCMEKLEAARRGEIDFGLDPRPVDEGGKTDWRVMGSNYKFTSKPFSDSRVINADGTAVE